MRDRILSMLSLLEYNIHKVASQYLIYNLIGKYRLNQNTINAQCTIIVLLELLIMFTDDCSARVQTLCQK